MRKIVKIAKTEHIDIGNGIQTAIYDIRSARQLINIAKKFEDKEGLRWIITNDGHCWAWDAEAAIHAQVLYHLGYEAQLETDNFGRYEFVENYPFGDAQIYGDQVTHSKFLQITVYNDQDRKSQALVNPTLRRIFPQLRIPLE